MVLCFETVTPKGIKNWLTFFGLVAGMLIAFAMLLQLDIIPITLITLGPVLVIQFAEFLRKI